MLAEMHARNILECEDDLQRQLLSVVFPGSPDSGILDSLAEMYDLKE